MRHGVGSRMAERLGLTLVALSLASIAFASTTFVCGAIHAVFDVRSGRIYELPAASPWWWLGAQLAIVVVWPLFLVAAKGRARRRAADAGAWIIAWPIAAAASCAVVYAGETVRDCDWWHCSMHDHTWADLSWIAAASVLPAWRITLVHALWPAPRTIDVRARHSEPVAG